MFSYIHDMRQRLGLEPNDESRDDYIKSKTPMQRLRMLCGWHLGDENWASNFVEWAKDAGFDVKEH
jgi:hypothetical protein